MTAVAVVGVGAMGGRMARRLLDAGHEVLIWNRTPGRVSDLVELGAMTVESPAEAARRATAVITMVSDPAALSAVTDGRAGLAAGAGSSVTVIEMSTVGPEAMTRLAAVLPAGTGLLDAPVLGSLSEAESGSLMVFVGGPASLVERWRPLLSTLGSPIHVGPLGAGAAAKLVANLTLFGALGVLGEALALADGLDLSRDAAFAVLATTPLAAQAERRRMAIESGQYPSRFPLSLARKDAELIRGAARAAGVDLRLGEAARTWLADAGAAGGGTDQDYTRMLAAILGDRSSRTRASSTMPVPRGRRQYDGLIVDLDGVVWLSGRPIDGAAEAIAKLRARGTRLLFLTNDPQSSRDELAARLTAIDIPATTADVLTSAAATARFLASQRHLRGNRALVIGSPALRREIEEAGFHLVAMSDARRAELVVVSGHDRFDYAELQAATTAVVHGAELFATGRDPVVPSPDGPRPATGAILAAVETATGVTANVIGKPEPFVFEVARTALSGCENVAVVGDNLASDIAGAKRSGLDALLVLTGTATENDLEQAAIQPDLVLASLAELAELDWP
jgi:HAD superfamily hydrolase (TIGR01450 family)